MPTKPKTKNNNWDKVYIISGEPQLCKMALAEVFDKISNPGIKRYYKDDDAKKLASSFNSFSFNASPDAIVVNNPKAEMLKVCQSAVENGPFNVSALIIFNPGDYMDGRLSFVTAANKNKRTYHYDCLETVSRVALTAYIKDWESGTGVNMTDEARKWLIANAPTTTGKVKTQAGKKEAEVFDLELMESELDKPYIMRVDTGQKITIDDLQELCTFEQGHDVWAFIAASIDGRVDEAYREIGRMLESQDIKSAIALLMSQLKFLIGLKSLGDKYLSSSSDYEIAAKISLSPYLNYYLTEDWVPLETPSIAPAINPWRVKKACESTPKWSLEQLCRQYTAAAYAYKDLRFGVPGDILLPYLMMALSGKIEYREPITS
jgi:DNA polymerase III delta subunit